jgi:hypothetical protein
VTEVVGKRGEVWVRSFMGVGAKKEMVAKRTKATKVVDSEGHEVDILCDKISKNIGIGATDGELLLFILVVLGRSSYCCG